MNGKIHLIKMPQDAAKQQLSSWNKYVHKRDDKSHPVSNDYITTWSIDTDEAKIRIW